MSKYRVFLLLLAGTVAASATYSQDVDTNDWICEFCPFEDGQRADLSMGASSVSDDSAYFGDASGYSEDSVYVNIDGSGSHVGDSHRLQWRIEDLGLNSRSAVLSGANQGRYDFSVAYRQLPRHQFFTSNTIFLQSADILSLPSGWVRAPLTSGFTNLNTNLVRRNIESERRTLEIDGSYLPLSRLKFSANYRRQERDGLDIYAGSYFTQSSLLPASFEYVTDILDLGIRYAGDKGIIALEYYVSEFDSGDTALRWENPFTASSGAEVAALARPPDNSFQQLSLSGRYRFSNYQTIASFSAAVGRMQQDEALLPYTTNLNLAASPLPLASLDAQIDTTNLAFRLTAKVFEQVRVKLAFRYDERDNRTAQYSWTRIIADSFASGEPEINIPYSFERSVLNFSADYKVIESVRISGGFDRKTVDRDFREVAEQTEDSGWVRLRWRPKSAFNIDFRAGASERNIDRYDETFAVTLGQNRLMRKYDLAYRYRRFAKFTIAASIAESPLALTIDGMYADDEYTQSQMGITNGKDLRLAANLNWALSNGASLYLNVGYQNIESEQSGSEAFALPDWHASNEDDFYTTGGGFRIRQIGGKVDLRMDYMRSSGTSKINMISAAGGLDRFPNLESTLDYLRLRLSYRHSNRLKFLLNIRYQSFVAEDWSLEGVEPGSIPVILTLGANPYDDQVLIIGLGIRYSIGGSDNSIVE